MSSSTDEQRLVISALLRKVGWEQKDFEARHGTISTFNYGAAEKHINKLGEALKIKRSAERLVEKMRAARSEGSKRMSKAYFERPAEENHHRVTIKLTWADDGRANLEIRTNAEEGQLARDVPTPWGHGLRVGEELTVVIED